jgi:hypothetical protein
MSFTLATLKTAIQDYMQVSETTFDNNLDEFIRTSENRIFNLVQLPQQRKNVQGNASSGSRFVALPDDFYAPFSFALIDSSSKYHYLLLKHVSFMKEFSPTSTTTGQPRYYSIFDNTAFELSPVPNANFDIEIHYLNLPDSLTAGASSGTTLLSTRYPDSLFFGALVEAAVFLKEPPDVVGMFETRFKEMVGRIKNISEGRQTKDEYRYDMLRVGVS